MEKEERIYSTGIQNENKTDLYLITGKRKKRPGWFYGVVAGSVTLGVIIILMITLLVIYFGGVPGENEDDMKMLVITIDDDVETITQYYL